MPRITAFRRIGTLLLCLVSLSLLAWRFYPSAQTSHSPTSLALKAPPFISVAKAKDAAVASTISDEAGISAYFQTPGPITLSSVRSKFRTIERETTDYIIGSVPLTGYPENYDVHVYVQKDGWILAYYLKQDPTSKIFDWLTYESNGATAITTNLETAIATIVNAVNVVLTTATYYNFQYPNATHLMLIAEAHINGNDSFQINIPNNFAVFERSWSFTGINGGDGYYLDDVLFYKDSQNGQEFSEGLINLTQLLPSQFHTVLIKSYSKAYGGLALVYKEQ